MAFDAFCYFAAASGNAPDALKGETQDSTYKGKGAFEILSFEIGAENNINIGSISGGGGAGKASFKELNITKKTDLLSTEMFSRLCTGNHFPDMTIVLRRTGGAGEDETAVFLQWEFKLVMIQDISWSGSDGDDICEETVVMQYGAMKVTYKAQTASGKHDGGTKDASWSRVLNKADLSVTPT